MKPCTSVQSVLVAVVILTSLASAIPAGADCPPIDPSEYWKNTFDFPDDPFLHWETYDLPNWGKFTILTCDPSLVYWQDCNAYPFHYTFAVELLAPIFGGMNAQEFEEATLYEEGQLGFLGAILIAPGGTPEYGIQLIRTDPYSQEEVRDLFAVIRSSINADPNVTGLYFPTPEQAEAAEAYSEWLAQQDPPIIVSSPARWATNNTIYSEGWALGELKYFDWDDIEDAYLDGRLEPYDVLLTDAVPSEVPFVSGILTLSASMPNSHVAILANTFGVPFVYLSMAEDADLAQQMFGKRIALRAYEKDPYTTTKRIRLIDADSLTEQQVSEILDLKVPPPLNILPTAPYGAYSAPTDGFVLSDIQYFGGKAANFGLIRRSIPDRSPVATAFSFDLWNEFLDQTMEGGNTLREQIDAILANHPTWPPPDMQALADDLNGIRDMIRNDAIFTPTLKQAVIDTLQDPQYGFDQTKKIRFRSSTNVEDSEQFTGAGLYDSYSGCLADELDGDAARYVSAWPCDAAIGMDDIYAWSVSSVGDIQGSFASANGDVGNPGVFVGNACPTGACCIDGSCTETTHSECVGTQGGSYQGEGTTCGSVTCPQPGEGQMRITEYMYSGSGGEFIEFSNVGTESIDMTGWSYDDESSIPGTVDLSAFGLVAPGESVILTEDPAATFISDWACPDITIIGGLSANIGRNDEINLYDALDAQVDRLTYGDEVFPGSIRTRYASGWPCDLAVGDNNIYGWFLSSVGDVQDSYASAGGDVGSPGSFVNDPCPTGACCIEGACTETTRGDCIGVHGGLYQGDGTTCGSVTCPQPGEGQMRITEYMSMGGGGEFIEVTNLGAEPVDMTGWSYDDESGIPGTVDLSAFGLVAPGESVILTEDPAATFESDWSLSGVTIIGGLTVNLGGSDAIHLYDASDMLVDRLAYQEDEGPSQCDPDEAEERGVFRAIGKVFASFYNDNAFLERLRYGVPESDVGMALLVHHSFPDEIELANGVATLEKPWPDDDYWSATLVTQYGATSVANPEGGVIPEEVSVSIELFGEELYIYPQIVQYSNLLPLGTPVMDWEDDYIELAEYLWAVAGEFVAATGKATYELDFEYKKVEPGGGALPGGGLVVKQVREIPRPSDEPSITPFLINEPTEYVIHGARNTVFAAHRLKSRWLLETQNMWLTEGDLAAGLYGDATLVYLEDCRLGTLSGLLPSWPGAWHTFSQNEAVDGWIMSGLENPRTYELQTKNIRTLVAPSESPLLTIRDLGSSDSWYADKMWLDVQVNYETPVLSWSGEGPEYVTTETVKIWPEPEPQSGEERLQEREFDGEHGGNPFVITTSYYWAPGTGVCAGCINAVSNWNETIIEGLTTEPIVLHGYHSQTYSAGQHNFTELFIFEPRLEAGMSPQQLDELEAADVRMIYVVSIFGETTVTIFGDDGTECDPCGDLDDDGDVDGGDYYLFVAASDSCIGDPEYLADADLDGDGCVTPGDYQTWLECYSHSPCGVYGDVYPAPAGDGVVDLYDLLCMLDGLRGLFTCPGVTFEDLDIWPCDLGNGDINLYDLLNLLDALAGLPACPDPCP